MLQARQQEAIAVALLQKSEGLAVAGFRVSRWRPSQDKTGDREFSEHVGPMLNNTTYKQKEAMRSKNHRTNG